MILDVLTSLLYFLGLGCLIQAGLDRLGAQDHHAQPWRPIATGPTALARDLSIRIALGILTYGAAMTTGLPLRAGFLVGAVGAGLGLFLAARRFHRQPPVGLGLLAALAWIGLALLLVALVSPVLPMDVLWANDARSVWFFHGKIIYFANGIHRSSGWNNEAILFSHPYYQKLVPILAATEMLKFGYWNEYLPKLALATPLTCYVLALFAGPRGRASMSTVATTVIALLGSGTLIHVGYVDAYTALPAAGALWAVMRWLSSGNPRDAEHALVLAGLALSTKDEGRLFAAGLAVGVLPFLAVRRLRWAAWSFLRTRTTWALLVLALAPALLWSIRVNEFGLHHYLQLNLATQFRALHRLRTGALPTIVRALIDPSSRWFDSSTSVLSRLLIVAGVVKLLAMVLSRRLRLVTFVCASAGVAYFSAICVVYLMTPADLRWQLSTSADRVMLIVFMCALGLLADGLEDLEGFTLGPRRKAVVGPRPR